MCKPDGGSAIVDLNAQSYEGLDDFLANNKLFSEDEMITLPKQFPAVNVPGDLDLMTIPGHATNSSPAWWTAAGAALVLAGGGGWFLWSRAVQRKARRMFADMEASDPGSTNAAGIAPTTRRGRGMSDPGAGVPRSGQARARG